MTTKAERQEIRDAKREEDWKTTLASIRAGLPLEAKAKIPPPPKPQETRKELRKRELESAHRGRQRDILLALCDRQDWKCFWCGMTMTTSDPDAYDYRTLEHVVARSSGLSIVNHLTNLRAACRGCNNMRGQMNSVLKVMAEKRQLESLLEGSRNTIRRHKITMAGRCYWCKAKFHIKEWLHGRKR